MLRTNLMAKCVVAIGYKSFVIDADKGVQLLDLLADAEIYEEKYNGSGQATTYHIYANEGGNSGGIGVDLRLLPQSFYSISKLAGKPSNKC
jgi:hypothetical protein